MLFGINEAKREIISLDCAIVVEGQVDVITLSEAGVRNVIAPLGTAFTEDHARLIRRLASSAILVFDGDKAGNEAARRAFILLCRAGCLVKRCILPQEQDPDSLLKSQGADAIKELLSQSKPYIETEIAYSNPTSPEGRLSAINRIADLISYLDEQVLRDGMASLAAIKFQTTIEEIAKKIKSTKAAGKEVAGRISIGREWMKVLFATLVQRDRAINLWQETNWEECAEVVRGVAVLRELLDCRFSANDKSSIIAAIGERSQSLEKCVLQSIDYQLPESETEELIASCYNELYRDYLVAELSKLKTKLKANPSDHKEIMPQIMEAWKQIRDLEKKD